MLEEVPHQSVADAITDTAQVAAERPGEARDGAAMNGDDEVVEDPSPSPRT